MDTIYVGSVAVEFTLPTGIMYAFVAIVLIAATRR
jgi:hypothetical protein